MTNPMGLLIRENLKTLFRTKGFIFIVVAAFIPPGLTAAWVFTHQNDVVVTSVTMDPAAPLIGQNVTFTVTVESALREPVGKFNVTFRLGYFGRTERANPDDPTKPIVSYPFTDELNRTFTVDGLRAHETRSFNFTWAAQFGSHTVQAIADADDVIPEIEERNNVKFLQFGVRPPSTPPPRTPSQNATAGSTAEDLAITSFKVEPATVFEHKSVNFTVEARNNGTSPIQNASVSLHVNQLIVDAFGRVLLGEEVFTESNETSLAPGETTTIRFLWASADFGAFYAGAEHRVGPGQEDVEASNDYIFQVFTADREPFYSDPPPKATIKDFYRDILQLLHFRLLIPLIALFYAGGVLYDEKEKGNLLYLLARPLPRWTIPIARFFVSFVVAAAALLVGIIATYVLLLGTPNAEPGYFYWPILFSLLTLFVYTGFFTLVGVLWDRPYMIGLLYTMAFEAFILLGRSILINGRPLLQDWVQNLSLSYWVLEAFKGWDPKMAMQFWPAGEDAVNALYIILAIGVGSLLAASFVMKRREFDV